MWLFVLATFLYAAILPPFDVQDEIGHFFRASQIGYAAFPSVVEGQQSGALLPGSLVALSRDWKPDDPNAAPTKRPLATLTQALGTDAVPTQGTAFASFALLGSYPHFLYAPQAAAIAIGRLLGLPPLQLFYAGRLAGAVFGTTMILLASALAMNGRTVLLTMASLPGVCSQLGSNSADCVIFSLAFMATALAVRGAVGLAGRGVLKVLLTAALAMAKGVYLPLAFAGLRPPSAWSGRYIAHNAALVLLGAALFALWFGYLGTAHNPIQTYTDRRTLQHVFSAAPADQARFVFGHPFFVAKALLLTMAERAPSYVTGVIGRFGAFNVLLPWGGYVLGVAALLASLQVTQPAAMLPSAWQRCVWLVLSLASIVLVHLALYVTFTQLGSDRIEGVQGRYLVPALPLLLMALQMRPGPGLARWINRVFPVAAICLVATGLITAMRAYWIV